MNGTKGRYSLTPAVYLSSHEVHNVNKILVGFLNFYILPKNVTLQSEIYIYIYIYESYI